MAGSDFLGIGISGLLAFQRSLNTTSNNIANVNTPGYSRQRVDLGTRPPQGTSAGFLGSGVQAMSVDRVYNQFLVDQVTRQTTLSSQLQTYLQFAGQVDNLMADPNAGLSPSLQEFFSSVQGVADDPASIPARQVMLSEADSVVTRLEYIYDRLDSLYSGLNTQLTNVVSEVNSLAGSIAKLNDDIVLQEGLANGQPANDLRDRRDELIRQLAEQVNVSTVAQDDGAINVFIGNGQNLVVGNRASTLNITGNAFDASQLEISISTGAGPGVEITRAMKGGAIGGLLDFRAEILEPSLNSLGQVAAGLAIEFNQQHRLGMDLNNNLGGDFFAPLAADVAANINNAGVGSVSGLLTGAAGLTDSDYNLRYDGANAYTLTRLSDNATFAINTGGVTPFTAAEIDGVTLTINAGAAVGDTFLIRPTRFAARDMDVLVSDVRNIAAAAPIRTTTSITNQGDGVISAGEVVDTANAAFSTTAGALTPPILVQFMAPNMYAVYDNTNPAAPVLLENNIPYDPATGSDVFPTPLGLDFGYRVHISGSPAANDEFTVDYNTSGVSDNRNALGLAGLQTQKTMLGGNADFQEAYGQLVADVGTRTHQAELNSEAQTVLLNQAIEARESVSGVNLDEEAADLLRFQQAYQAAAQVITTANSLFQTLIEAVN